MSTDEGYEQDTEPGAVDDDATKRVKKRKKTQQQMLDEIFNDNKTNRYGSGTDS